MANSELELVKVKEAPPPTLVLLDISSDERIDDRGTRKATYGAVTVALASNDFFCTDELAVDELIPYQSSINDKCFDVSNSTISKHSGVRSIFIGWSEGREMLNKKSIVPSLVIMTRSPMLVPLS
jgi:hypothetical protein